MVNISKFALCAIIFCLLPMTVVQAIPVSKSSTNKAVTAVMTNKTSSTMCTTIVFPLGALTNRGTNIFARPIMTNHTYFTGHTYIVPPKSANWPEVQDVYREDIFKDVHEVDTESAVRRFEIVFLISFPATLLLNTAILTVLKFAETGVVGGGFETTRNYYLYAGAGFMSLGIACQDYRNIRKKRDERGLQWEILSKKF